MSYSSQHSSTITPALHQLQPLELDNYIVAIGPGHEQFTGTPNGYKVTHLPPAITNAIALGHINKITWASYGCNTESWFFAFELADGKPSFEYGHGIPRDLISFIRNLQGSEILLAALRVQLGANDSFVAWSMSAWACANVPPQLQAKLREGSSASLDGVITKGSLRNGTLDNVQWHTNGSFYIKSGHVHLVNFQSKLMDSKWNELWEGLIRSERMRKINGELAYVTISPYSRHGETFVFIKKQVQGKEPPFIVSFEGEPVHSNLAISTAQATADAVTASKRPHSAQRNRQAFALPKETSLPDHRIQHIPHNPEEDVPFQWATSKKSGRPHRNDGWELELTKGKKVKVTRDMGRGWFLVMGAQGRQGYVHGSWLDFGDGKVHRDLQAAYTQFRGDVKMLQLAPGWLVKFPNMASYVDECSQLGCQQLKEDDTKLGICIHDLRELLAASGKCSYEWLREGRNVWHPDRFARFCHAEHVDEMKPMAEQMFVMYTKLMDFYKV
ncbi:SH3 3 domain containing protein [Pyrenophora teres f. maculata]|nr:SH3 3 domain containing protein [Pyrenophora teres f. maculata]